MQTATPGLYTGAMDVVRKSIARDGLVRVLAFFSRLESSFSNSILRVSTLVSLLLSGVSPQCSPSPSGVTTSASSSSALPPLTSPPLSLSQLLKSRLLVSSPPSP